MLPFGGNKSGGPSAPACPVAAVLRPLANTAVFGPGAERKPLYVAWYGILSDISVNCKIDGPALRVVLDSVIIAERGPAGRNSDVDLDYFVSLAASDQTILGKKSFSVHVTLAGNDKRAGVNDHVEVVFNTGGRPLSDLSIAVGFQQTPDVIEFYKNYRGR